MGSQQQGQKKKKEEEKYMKAKTKRTHKIKNKKGEKCISSLKKS